MCYVVHGAFTTHSRRMRDAYFSAFGMLSYDLTAVNVKSESESTLVCESLFTVSPMHAGACTRRCAHVRAVTIWRAEMYWRYISQVVSCECDAYDVYMWWDSGVIAASSGPC